MRTRATTWGLRRLGAEGTVERHGLAWKWVWCGNLPLPEQAVRCKPPRASGLPRLRELRRMAPLSLGPSDGASADGIRKSIAPRRMVGGVHWT